MKITTNGHTRPFINWKDLSKGEQEDFDYLDEDYNEMFRYGGILYAVADFMTYQGDKYWDGAAGDSFFSGILIKLDYDNYGVICGTYYT